MKKSPPHLPRESGQGEGILAWWAGAGLGGEGFRQVPKELPALPPQVAVARGASSGWQAGSGELLSMHERDSQ